MRHVFTTGIYRPSSTLLAFSGDDVTLVLRGAKRPNGFFDGPPLHVSASMGPVEYTARPKLEGAVADGTSMWQSTMLYAGNVTVAFDPPIVRWVVGGPGVDERTLTATGVVRVRVNMAGHADMNVVSESYNTWLFDVQREGAQITYLAGVTICIEMLKYDDEYADEARALLRAVGRIEKRRNRAARVIGRAWRRAVACPEYKVRLAASGAPCAPRVPGQAEQGVRRDALTRSGCAAVAA